MLAYSKTRCTFVKPNATGEWDTPNGGLAQLARALAWHARGHRFDSDILHQKGLTDLSGLFLFLAEAAGGALVLLSAQQLWRQAPAAYYLPVSADNKYLIQHVARNSYLCAANFHASVFISIFS
jgi:hypothetical protein